MLRVHISWLNVIRWLIAVIFTARSYEATRQCDARKSNPRSIDYESDALTTTLPRVKVYLATVYQICAMLCYK